MAHCDIQKLIFDSLYLINFKYNIFTAMPHRGNLLLPPLTHKLAIGIHVIACLRRIASQLEREVHGHWIIDSSRGHWLILEQCLPIISNWKSECQIMFCALRACGWITWSCMEHGINFNPERNLCRRNHEKIPSTGAAPPRSYLSLKFGSTIT